MPKIDIRGTSLHYLRLGEGPDVVLLHGLTANLACWYPTIVTGLRDYRLTLLDLRGHGRSAMSPSGYSTRDLAADLASLFDRLEIPRAHVMGHSYGGAVALHFATLQPSRTASLILADVRIRALQPTQAIHHWSHWPIFREKLARIGIEIPEGDPDTELRLLAELARRALDGQLEGVDLEPFFVPFSAANRRAALQWLKLVDETTALPDFRDVAGLTQQVIRTVEQPTLAVYGEFSHCLPSQRALAELLPRCTTALVAGAGHYLPLVKPQALLAEARRFLSQWSSRC